PDKGFEGFLVLRQRIVVKSARWGQEREVLGGGACRVRRVPLSRQRRAVDCTVVASIEPGRWARMRSASYLIADQEPREHPPRRGQSGPDEHRGAKATREGGRVAIGMAGQTGEPGNHRDGEEACAARDRVVDARRNTGVPRGGGRERSGGQRSNGQRQPQARTRTTPPAPA